MNDQQIEAEIQAKGLTAPRITVADIETSIVSTFYFTAADGVRGESEMGTAPAGRARSLDYLTFCVLVLRNGFTVTGESACASPENFNAELGRKIARENALQKIWALEGYLLKERLHWGMITGTVPETVPPAPVSAAPAVSAPVIAPGTIVKLKSGGPDMVAGHTLENGNVECQWHVGAADVTFDIGQFPPACLKVIR